MASVELARDLLGRLASLREGVDTLEDPEREPLRLRLKQALDLLQSVEKRAASEVARARSGVGAAPRYTRLA